MPQNRGQTPCTLLPAIVLSDISLAQFQASWFCPAQRDFANPWSRQTGLYRSFDPPVHRAEDWVLQDLSISKIWELGISVQGRVLHNGPFVIWWFRSVAVQFGERSIKASVSMGTWYTHQDYSLLDYARSFGDLMDAICLPWPDQLWLDDRIVQLSPASRILENQDPCPLFQGKHYVDRRWLCCSKAETECSSWCRLPRPAVHSCLQSIQSNVDATWAYITSMVSWATLPFVRHLLKRR